MIEFKMPSLGADMDAGTLVEWLKKPGDAVKRGDIIAVVDTQKSAIEIEVFADGILDRLLVEPGQRVPVGTVMATIREPGDLADAGLPPKAVPSSASPPAAKPSAPVAPASAPPVAARGEPRATPAARRRAVELGVEIASVLPGPEGVIGLGEVEAAAGARAPAKPQRPGGISFDEMRKAIGAAMARSHREIPHYYVSSTLDVSPLMAWLEAENTRRPVPERLLYAAPLIRAVARALMDSPELNGHYVDGRYDPAEHVNLGIAVAMRGGGLIAPAILAAETLDLAAIMERLRDLVARVRGGRLRSSEMTAGTATITNLGEGTADSLMPLIYPPQVAIVGCGRIVERPWIVDGKIEAAKLMTVTVAGDHRISDGRRAAAFLMNLDKLLHSPETL